MGNVEFEEDHIKYEPRVVTSSKIAKRSSLIRFMVNKGWFKTDISAQRFLVYTSIIIFLVSLGIFLFGTQIYSPTLIDIEEGVEK